MAVTSMANSSLRDFKKYNRMSSALGAGPFPVSYLVIAGGGGGAEGSGGAGAGGYRTNGGTSGGGAGSESN